MADLLRRPEVEFAHLRLLENTLPDLPPDLIRQVEDEIKYRGYIERERLRVERRARHESRMIPPGFDYKRARGLSREAVDKLSHRLPRTIGEAARVPGISPADLAVLEILIAAPNCGPLPDQPEGDDSNGP